MPVDSVQMQLIRRYARALREQQTTYRGPRIGAKERRAARETAQAVTDAAGAAGQRALNAVRSPKTPAA